MEIDSQCNPANSSRRDSCRDEKVDHELRKTAVSFEASFLAEMLKLAGLGQTNDTFAGGPGEDAFSSFLTRQHAERIAQVGGVGLAVSIFRSLKNSGFDR